MKVKKEKKKTGLILEPDVPFKHNSEIVFVS